ncbi:MAG: hypothetical protein KIS91_13115, partial [Anaerolineae bacterium]|nr:hypothetical protein [Anaerolineae bacterium]
MPRLSRFIIGSVVALAAIVLAVVILAAPGVSWGWGDAHLPFSALSAERGVTDAWQRAQRADEFRFKTNVAQTTHPAPALANVGHSSREDSVHVEGRLQRADQRIQMRVWQGAAWEDGDGVEMRVEGDKTYGRAPNGEWREVDSVADAFAPGQDAL